MFSPTSQFECAKIHSVKKYTELTEEKMGQMKKFTTTTIYGSSSFF